MDSICPGWTRLPRVGYSHKVIQTTLYMVSARNGLDSHSSLSVSAWQLALQDCFIHFESSQSDRGKKKKNLPKVNHLTTPIDRKTWPHFSNPQVRQFYRVSSFNHSTKGGHFSLLRC